MRSIICEVFGIQLRTSRERLCTQTGPILGEHTPRQGRCLHRFSCHLRPCSGCMYERPVVLITPVCLLILNACNSPSIMRAYDKANILFSVSFFIDFFPVYSVFPLPFLKQDVVPSMDCVLSCLSNVLISAHFGPIDPTCIFCRVSVAFLT